MPQQAASSREQHHVKQSTNVGASLPRQHNGFLSPENAGFVCILTSQSALMACFDRYVWEGLLGCQLGAMNASGLLPAGCFAHSMKPHSHLLSRGLVKAVSAPSSTSGRI